MNIYIFAGKVCSKCNWLHPN